MKRLLARAIPTKAPLEPDPISRPEPAVASANRGDAERTSVKDPVYKRIELTGAPAVSSEDAVDRGGL